jgi:hypothetical protein
MWTLLHMFALAVLLLIHQLRLLRLFLIHQLRLLQLFLIHLVLPVVLPHHVQTIRIVAAMSAILIVISAESKLKLLSDTTLV